MRMHPSQPLLSALLLLLSTGWSGQGAALGFDLSRSYGAPPSGDASSGGSSGGYDQGPNFSTGFGADPANSLILGGNAPAGETPVSAGDDFGPPPVIPATSFQCGDFEYPGYYADVEVQCSVFHICQEDGRHDAFLCPLGTQFNHKYLVCDWPAAVDCQNSDQFFSVNAEIGKIPEGGLPSPGGEVEFFPGVGHFAPAFEGSFPGAPGVANPPSTSYGLPN